MIRAGRGRGREIRKARGMRGKHWRKDKLASIIALAIVLSLLFLDLPVMDATATSQSLGWVEKATPYSNSGKTHNSMLHREGTHIVDGDGNPIQLRGVNLGGWLLWESFEYGTGFFTMTGETKYMSRLMELVGQEKALRFRTDIYNSFIREEDIKAISDCGFNVVRVPINHLALNAISGWCWDSSMYTDEGWALLDALMEWCEKYGVYVILDLHSAPAPQTQLWFSDWQWFEPMLWDSPSGREKTYELWRSIATRYKDREIVAGYELLNELTTYWKHDLLLEFYHKTIAIIREVDPYHLILLEGDFLSRDFSMFNSILDDNQAWAPHLYVMSIDDQRKMIKELQALNAPVVCTEFGGTDYKTVKEQVALFEETGTSWTFWTWKTTTETPEWSICEIHHTPTWDKVVNWLADEWFAPKPSYEETIQGMKEFMASVLYENCTLHEEMLNALVSGW